MGRNRLDARFLYVSDGGHYENLGLVELLRRGCITIYCFDAGGGSDCRALGDAIALARSELQIEIEIDSDELREVDGVAKSDCAKGTITYPNRVKGALYYVRSVLTKDLPYDVLAYAEVDGSTRINARRRLRLGLYSKRRTIGSCIGCGSRSSRWHAWSWVGSGAFSLRTWTIPRRERRSASCRRERHRRTSRCQTRTGGASRPAARAATS